MPRHIDRHQGDSLHDDLESPADEASYDGLSIELPVSFIEELSASQGIDDIMNVIARWSRVIFRADRVTIALPGADADHLRLVAMEGNDAIPIDMPVPVSGTMVGRVFAQGKAEICPDLSLLDDWDCKILSDKGLKSCLDVPLLSALLRHDQHRALPDICAGRGRHDAIAGDGALGRHISAHSSSDYGNADTGRYRSIDGCPESPRLCSRVRGPVCKPA